MNFQITLLQACAELVELGYLNFLDTLAYFKAHGIAETPERRYAIGVATLCRIADCGSGMFDFDPDGFSALACEALADDAETVIDLVAWPIHRPAHVLTMFGRCGLLGAFEAMNPATYYLDTPLVMHQSPLDWLKADCRGASVVTNHIAARMLLDLPGKIAANDEVHGRQLEVLRRSVLPANQILVPTRKGELAK